MGETKQACHDQPRTRTPLGPWATWTTKGTGGTPQVPDASVGTWLPDFVSKYWPVWSWHAWYRSAGAEFADATDMPAQDAETSASCG